MTQGGVATEDRATVARFLRELPISFVEDNQKPFFFTGMQLKSTNAFASLNMSRIPNTQAQFDFVEPTLQGLGFTVTQPPGETEYGGADLFRVSRQLDNGQELSFYMSLVSLKLGSGTFLVLWRDNPNVTP
ncbi:MAG: hypothetical protein HC838_03420 [Spirulinaceae cyanobacterium RM2_2_10]|nr:hypothetical protein [Spirulinaceae cyanobacterium RM2_2_10]